MIIILLFNFNVIFFFLTEIGDWKLLLGAVNLF